MAANIEWDAVGLELGEEMLKIAQEVGQLTEEGQLRIEEINRKVAQYVRRELEGDQNAALMVRQCQADAVVVAKYYLIAGKRTAASRLKEAVQIAARVALVVARNVIA